MSFSHLSLLLSITDPLERAFCETMAIRGTWSVRELQRQIDSNYYFRSGWSQKPEALAKLVEGKAETDTLALDIKSPFTFEFLGLQAKDVVEESHSGDSPHHPSSKILSWSLVWASALRSVRRKC